MFKKFGQGKTVHLQDDEVSPSGEEVQMSPVETLKIELDNIISSFEFGSECPKDMEMNFKSFLDLFSRFHATKSTSTIDWNEIMLLNEQEIKNKADLNIPSDREHCRKLLNKLVVLKLNGGLGTSMGCIGPKSVIKVRDELTFLDMIVKQIETLNKEYKCDIPLVLMNSFNTDADTQKIINQYKSSNVKIYNFMQKKFPRIYQETLMPVPKPGFLTDSEAWYPPGHGDIYECFEMSGLLDLFMQNGKEWIFVSNVDNLGATVDFDILHELCQSNYDFIMEVTEKTRADIKGGTLIRYKNKLTLLEAAQVPKEKMEEFKNVTKFKIFNTNNLWVQLKKMKDLVTRKRLKMDIIVNYKNLANGQSVIQLEQPAGAAISNFDNAIGLRVPRSRFLPVKTTSDLLLVKSNLYSVNEGELKISSKRQFSNLPLVKLGPQFKSVKQFSNRFATIPDIIELDHLTVVGDVNFGVNVTLRGTVIIITQEGEHIDIPARSVLDNKIVSGNCHILDY